MVPQKNWDSRNYFVIIQVQDRSTVNFVSLFGLLRGERKQLRFFNFQEHLSHEC
jgi:hypothetical protein